MKLGKKLLYSTIFCVYRLTLDPIGVNPEFSPMKEENTHNTSSIKYNSRFISGTSGGHLDGIWRVSRRHLEGIWRASRGHLKYLFIMAGPEVPFYV